MPARFHYSFIVIILFFAAAAIAIFVISISFLHYYYCHYIAIISSYYCHSLLHYFSLYLHISFYWHTPSSLLFFHYYFSLSLFIIHYSVHILLIHYLLLLLFIISPPLLPYFPPDIHFHAIFIFHIFLLSFFHCLRHSLFSLLCLLPFIIAIFSSYSSFQYYAIFCLSCLLFIIRAIFCYYLHYYFIFIFISYIHYAIWAIMPMPFIILRYYYSITFLHYFHYSVSYYSTYMPLSYSSIISCPFLLPIYSILLPYSFLHIHCYYSLHIITIFRCCFHSSIIHFLPYIMIFIIIFPLLHIIMPLFSSFHIPFAIALSPAFRHYAMLSHYAISPCHIFASLFSFDYSMHIRFAILARCPLSARVHFMPLIAIHSICPPPLCRYSFAFSFCHVAALCLRLSPFRPTWCPYVFAFCPYACIPPAPRAICALRHARLRLLRISLASFIIHYCFSFIPSFIFITFSHHYIYSYSPYILPYYSLFIIHIAFSHFSHFACYHS